MKARSPTVSPSSRTSELSVERGRPQVVGVALGVGVVGLAVGAGRPAALGRLPLGGRDADVEPVVRARRPRWMLDRGQARPRHPAPLAGSRSKTWATSCAFVAALGGDQDQPVGAELDRPELRLPTSQVGQPVLLAGRRVHQREPRAELVHARAVAEQDQAVVGDPVEVLPVVAVEVLVRVRREHAVVAPLDRLARRRRGAAWARPAPAARPPPRLVGRRRPDDGGGRDDGGDVASAAPPTTAARRRRTRRRRRRRRRRGRGGRAGGAATFSRISSSRSFTMAGCSSPATTSSSRDASSNMDRSEASAREVWLLTVPSLQPSAAAVSRTSRSSK